MSLDHVERAIADALDAATQAVEPVAEPSADLLTALRELASGGKRLRARLLLASHDFHGALHPSAAHHVAAAIELFQAAALIHDDVLDQAHTRRGAATIHRHLARVHGESSWQGDAEHFGVSGAILAGDIALMAAQLTLSRGTADLDSASAGTVAELFAHMSILCTAGQYADMRLAAQPVDALASQEAEILAMMRSKTASYTSEFPLALGAACAGGDPEKIAAMRAVGVPLGLAFQLRDDVLGLVGQTELTGKPAGDDIREGKRTLLMVHAWRHADAGAQDVLRRAFARPDADAASVAAAVRAVEETGAIGATEERIRLLADEARAALHEAIPAPSHGAALDSLHALLDATTQRAS
jgi:geranylgeranyl diphosphate synthase type I